MEEEEECLATKRKMRKINKKIRKLETEVEDILKAQKEKERMLHSVLVEKEALKMLKAVKQVTTNGLQGREEDQALPPEPSTATADPALTPPGTSPSLGDMTHTSGASSPAPEDLTLRSQKSLLVEGDPASGDMVSEPAANAPDIRDLAKTQEVLSSAPANPALPQAATSPSPRDMAHTSGTSSPTPEDLNLKHPKSLLVEGDPAPEDVLSKPAAKTPGIGDQAKTQEALCSAAANPTLSPAAISSSEGNMANTSGALSPAPEDTNLRHAKSHLVEGDPVPGDVVSEPAANTPDMADRAAIAEVPSSAAANPALSQAATSPSPGGIAHTLGASSPTAEDINLRHPKSLFVEGEPAPKEVVSEPAVMTPHIGDQGRAQEVLSSAAANPVLSQAATSPSPGDIVHTSGVSSLASEDPNLRHTTSLLVEGDPAPGDVLSKPAAKTPGIGDQAKTQEALCSAAANPTLSPAAISSSEGNMANTSGALSPAPEDTNLRHAKSHLVEGDPVPGDVVSEPAANTPDMADRAAIAEVPSSAAANPALSQAATSPSPGGIAHTLGASSPTAEDINLRHPKSLFVEGEPAPKEVVSEPAVMTPHIGDQGRAQEVLSSAAANPVLSQAATSLSPGDIVHTSGVSSLASEDPNLRHTTSLLVEGDPAPGDVLSKPAAKTPDIGDQSKTQEALCSAAANPTLSQAVISSSEGNMANTSRASSPAPENLNLRHAKSLLVEGVPAPGDVVSELAAKPPDIGDQTKTQEVLSSAAAEPALSQGATSSSEEDIAHTSGASSPSPEDLNLRHAKSHLVEGDPAPGDVLSEPAAKTPDIGDQAKTQEALCSASANPALSQEATSPSPGDMVHTSGASSSSLEVLNLGNATSLMVQGDPAPDKMNSASLEEEEEFSGGAATKSKMKRLNKKIRKLERELKDLLKAQIEKVRVLHSLYVEKEALKVLTPARQVARNRLQGREEAQALAAEQSTAVADPALTPPGISPSPGDMAQKSGASYPAPEELKFEPYIYFLYPKLSYYTNEINKRLRCPKSLSVEGDPAPGEVVAEPAANTLDIGDQAATQEVPFSAAANPALSEAATSVSPGDMAHTSGASSPAPEDHNLTHPKSLLVEGDSAPGVVVAKPAANTPDIGDQSTTQEKPFSAAANPALSEAATSVSPGDMAHTSGASSPAPEDHNLTHPKSLLVERDPAPGDVVAEPAANTSDIGDQAATQEVPFSAAANPALSEAATSVSPGDIAHTSGASSPAPEDHNWRHAKSLLVEGDPAPGDVVAKPAANTPDIGDQSTTQEKPFSAAANPALSEAATSVSPGDMAHTSGASSPAPEDHNWRHAKSLLVEGDSAPGVVVAEPATNTPDIRDQAATQEKPFSAAANPALSEAAASVSPGDMAHTSGASSPAPEDHNLAHPKSLLVERDPAPGDVVAEPAAYTPGKGDQAATQEKPFSAPANLALCQTATSVFSGDMAHTSRASSPAPEGSNLRHPKSLLVEEDPAPGDVVVRPAANTPDIDDQDAALEVPISAARNQEVAPPMTSPSPEDMAQTSEVSSTVPRDLSQGGAASLFIQSHPAPGVFFLEPAGYTSGIGEDAVKLEVPTSTARSQGPTSEAQSSAEGYLALEQATSYSAGEDLCSIPVASFPCAVDDAPTPTVCNPVIAEQAAAEAVLLSAEEDPPSMTAAPHTVPITPPVICDPQSPAPVVERRSEEAKAPAAKAPAPFLMPTEAELAISTAPDLLNLDCATLFSVHGDLAPGDLAPEPVAYSPDIGEQAATLDVPSSSARCAVLTPPVISLPPGDKAPTSGPSSLAVVDLNLGGETSLPIQGDPAPDEKNSTTLEEEEKFSGDAAMKSKMKKLDKKIRKLERELEELLKAQKEKEAILRSLYVEKEALKVLKAAREVASNGLQGREEAQALAAEPSPAAADLALTLPMTTTSPGDMARTSSSSFLALEDLNPGRSKSVSVEGDPAPGDLVPEPAAYTPDGGEELTTLKVPNAAATILALTPPATSLSPRDMARTPGDLSTAPGSLNQGPATSPSAEGDPAPGDVVAEPSANTPDIEDQIVTTEVPSSAEGFGGPTPKTQFSAEEYLALEEATSYSAPEGLTPTPVVSVLPSGYDTLTPITPHPVLGEEAAEEAMALPAGEELLPMPAANDLLPTSPPAVSSPQSPALPVGRQSRRAKARAAKAAKAAKAHSRFPVPPEAKHAISTAPGVQSLGCGSSLSVEGDLAFGDLVAEPTAHIPDMGDQDVTLETPIPAARNQELGPAASSPSPGDMASTSGALSTAPEDLNLGVAISLSVQGDAAPGDVVRKPATYPPNLGDQDTTLVVPCSAGRNALLTPPVTSPSPGDLAQISGAMCRAAGDLLLEDTLGHLTPISVEGDPAPGDMVPKPAAYIPDIGDQAVTLEVPSSAEGIGDPTPETQLSGEGYQALEHITSYSAPEDLGPSPGVAFLPSGNDAPSPTASYPVLGLQAAAEAALSPTVEGPSSMPVARDPVPTSPPAVCDPQPPVPLMRRRSRKGKARAAKARSSSPMSPEGEFPISSNNPCMGTRGALSVLRKSEALLLEASLGNLRAVRRLLKKGADVSYAGSDGCSALHYAAHNGYVEVVNVLLSSGAPVDVKDQNDHSPLQYALEGKHREVVGALILEGAQIDERGLDGSTALHHSVFKDSVVWVEFLLGVGANPNSRDDYGCTPLHVASACNRAECVVLLLGRDVDIDAQCNDGSTALHRAAGANAAECVEVLINRGANIEAKNAKGNTPLLFAATYGCTDSVQALLRAKANVNAQNNKLNTALHLVSVCNATGCILLLLEDGADIEAKNKSEERPLHSAVHGKAHQSLQLLLDRGAEVNARDQYGNTPLHNPAAFDDVECLRLLLQRGADVNARNALGNTPLHLAATYNCGKCVRRLLGAKADASLTNNAGQVPRDLATANSVKALFR